MDTEELQKRLDDIEQRFNSLCDYLKNAHRAMGYHLAEMGRCLHSAQDSTDYLIQEVNTEISELKAGLEKD